MALQGLNKQQLEVIANTNQDRYSVRIFSAEPDLWQAGITLTDPLQEFHAFTSRGDLKTWRELAAAVGYIRETCPKCRTVTIEIGGWTFARTDLA